jgi:hypothetical protein
MSPIGSESAARLRCFAETAVWACVLAGGAWLAWRGIRLHAPLPLIAGGAIALTGLGLLVAALRSLRLNAQSADAGMVIIDEARIGYFGPDGGGFADLDALVRVEVTRHGPGGMRRPPAWVLLAADGSRLEIPVGARDAARLYDLLSTLPGMDARGALRSIEGRGSERVIVWSRTGREQESDRPGADRLPAGKRQ